MKIIQKLSDMIEEEIKDAEKYARCALEHKDDDPALADTFFKLANEEMGHMMALHGQVTKYIEAYKKEHGDPPEVMSMLYSIMHKKHVEDAAYVKGLLSLYK